MGLASDGGRENEVGRDVSDDEDCWLDSAWQTGHLTGRARMIVPCRCLSEESPKLCKKCKLEWISCSINRLL